MNLEKRSPAPPPTPSTRRRFPKPPHEGVIRVASVRPARALTVYILFAAVFLLAILLAVAFAVLYQRTKAVCEPLRSGQSLTTQATTEAGKGFAQTFGDAADSLGCRR